LGITGETPVPLRCRPAKWPVATFNINWDNPNLKEIVRVIRQSQADLVALQETNAVSERFLQAQLGRQYRYVKFRRPTDRYMAGRSRATIP